jgi:hypothetical protein
MDVQFGLWLILPMGFLGRFYHVKLMLCNFLNCCQNYFTLILGASSSSIEYSVYCSIDSFLVPPEVQEEHTFNQFLKILDQLTRLREISKYT